MDPLRVAYLLLFGTAGVGCLAAVWRARRVADVDTRTGLLALLLFSAVWALASVGRLLSVDPGLQQSLYVVGLVVGLAAVGAWLYFCSAYTGHDYHRQPRIRVTALGLYISVVAVKLTNPVHHLYYSTTTVTTPFEHTVVELHAAHWVVTGLAYALTAIGFYLLYELFSNSRFDTTRLGVLVVATGVPAVVDILAYAEAAPSVLLKFNFEPLGVAVFAIGALFVVDEKFVAVPQFWRRHVLERLDEAIVVLDDEGRIRDYNAAAAATFPGVERGYGTDLESAVPDLSPYGSGETGILALEGDDDPSYYRVRRAALTDSLGTRRGTVLICADVTDIERQRRQLARQTDQFDDFADAMTHELRNAVTLVDGYIGMVAETVDDDREGEVPIDDVSDAVDRMRRVIGDLTTLARHSQPLEEVGECEVGAAVEAAWDPDAFEGMSLAVERDGTIEANRRRLEELFRSLFAFSHATGATQVAVTLGDDAILLSDDGDELSDREVHKAFAYGEPVPSQEAGMSLPNARMLARSLGWSVRIDADRAGGTRVSVEGVTVTATADGG